MNDYIEKAGSEQINCGKVTPHQRIIAIAHMTSKYTNKNGVKLLAAIAVLTMALSVAIIAVPSADGTENEPIELTADNFITSITGGDGKYILNNNISVKITDNPVVKNTISIDLNGKSITLTGGSTIYIGEEKKADGNKPSLSFINTSNTIGKIIYNDFTRGDYAGFQVRTDGSFSMNGISFETNGSGILPSGDASVVSIIKSTISGGTYAIATNNSYTGTNTLSISISESTLNVSNYDNTDAGRNDNCAVLINANGVTLDISKSIINGDRQSVVVRCGTATITDTTINYSGDSGAKNLNYYDDKTWGSGNELPNAAIVVGDRSDSAYPGAASLTINGGSVVAADGMKAIVTSSDANTTCAITIGNEKATSISIGSNAVSIEKLQMNKAGLMITPGSIVIGGEIGGTATDIIILSGEAELIADIPNGTTITISEGASLIIPENETVDNAGSINIYGTFTNNGEITNSSNTGSITITGTEATVSGNGSSAIDTTTVIDTTGKTPISETILAFEGDVIIEGDAYLTGDLEIPAEKKLIIRSTGTLDLGGYGLTINGEFIVESGAKVFGSDATTSSTKVNTILLMKGASIQNDGILGAVKEVTVKAGSVSQKYAGVGEVKLLNGSGVEFGLVNTTSAGADEAQYTLTVTGDAYSDVASEIMMKNVRIVDNMTIGENVTLSIPNGNVKVYLMSGATLDVDGVMVIDDASKFIMKNKSTVIMNGVLVGKISAETGEYKTSDGWKTETGYTSVSITANSNYASFTTADVTNGITGFTLSVGSFSYQKTISNVKTAMTYQALYIDGDFDYIFVKANGSAPFSEVSMTVDGNNAYVSDNSKIILKKNMDIKVTGTTTVVGGSPINSNLYVLGQVVANSANAAGVDKYIGASYTIKGTTSDSNITYIEPFASAITKIADADGKKVTVTEDVEIDGSLTILENQVLDIKSKFTVKETGILTVDAKGKIIGTIDSVEGVLKVMKNGTCSAPTSYASVTKSADYTQYSGLKIAIKNAQPGETITIVSPAEVSDLEIPAGVTVESSAKITVKGNMTIAETAKVVLKDGTGEIDITKEKAKLTVNGELDASEGKITLTGTGAQIYSDGKTVIANSQNALLASSNAFVYVNDENQYVLTNAKDAISAVAAMDVAKNVDVYGTVSAGDLDLNTNMNIETESKVTFGNITIADGKEITVNGEVTGTFSVTTGIPETTGATVTSTIDLQKASGIVIGATSEVDAQNVRTYIFFIYGTLVGTADVIDGTVSVGKDESTSGTTDTLTVNKTTNKDSYLTIDEGATISIRSGMNLVVGYNVIGDDRVASVIVDGTLDVVKGGEVKSALNVATPVGILDISGTFSIGNSTTVEFDGMILMEGVIEISTTENKEGKLVAGGDIIMFDGASISGKIDIRIANYILAYVGADVSKAQINVTAGESAAFATAFYINSDICMTAYAITGSTVKTFDVIESAEFDVPGYDLSNIKKTTTETGTTTYWYTDADLEDEVDKVGTVLVKTVPAVYFNAPRATVTGTISAGVGLQIYLNGISVENYKVGTGYTLPVGTYKVTIENLSGYDKSKAVISFNGATVADGGSITISEKDFVLTATGAVPSVTPTPEPTPIQPTEKDDGMGLTEYLLIVLVILAAILVVVVAIRMMRS